jgi:hypothetical protein
VLIQAPLCGAFLLNSACRCNPGHARQLKHFSTVDAGFMQQYCHSYFLFISNFGSSGKRNTFCHPVPTKVSIIMTMSILRVHVVGYAGTVQA